MGPPNLPNPGLPTWLGVSLLRDLKGHPSSVIPDGLLAHFLVKPPNHLSPQAVELSGAARGPRFRPVERKGPVLGTEEGEVAPGEGVHTFQEVLEDLGEDAIALAYGVCCFFLGRRGL